MGIATDAKSAEKWRSTMMRNTFRGIVALVLTAAAAWLADRIADKVFGPDPVESSSN